MRRMFGMLAVVVCLSAACAAEVADEESGEAAFEEDGEVELEGLASALASPSFALISRTSGQAITGGSLTDGTQVSQTPFANTSNQRWVFDGQTARLTPASKLGLCMEPESSDVSARIRLRACNGAARQAWKLRIKVLSNGARAARFENLSTHQLLDNGGTLFTNAVTTQFPENGTNNQLFERRF
jgi:hypothetical protein